MAELYLALLHHPVFDKQGKAVTTSISNLDIHDIARLALTYNVKRYYIVHPGREQRKLLDRILSFWAQNSELPYNPHRSQALRLITPSDTIENTISEITKQEEMRPLIITTTAQSNPNQISHRYLRTLYHEPRPILILFGTGYGLCPEVHDRADHILEPVNGPGAYNHLSVRSAVSIVLDRICSEYIYGRNHGYSAPSWQRPNQNRLSRFSRGRYGEGPL